MMTEDSLKLLVWLITHECKTLAATSVLYRRKTLKRIKNVAPRETARKKLKTNLIFGTKITSMSEVVIQKWQ